MAALGTVLLVLGVEGFLLNSFQKSINRKNYGFALSSLSLLVIFMVFINVEWHKGELWKQAGDSKGLALIACGFLTAFILAPKKYRSAISDITSSWNGKTNNALAFLSAGALFLAIKG